MDTKLIIGNLEKKLFPTLSILIPTFRRDYRLIRAIDSVFKQSKIINFEVIVVSNDTQDDFYDIKERFSGFENFFLYQNSENIGMVQNSNKCVELARGEYIAFLHDDDYLLENYTNVIHKFLNNGVGDCLITGRYIDYENGLNKITKIKKVFEHLFTIKGVLNNSLKKILLKDCLKSNRNIYYSPSCGTVIKKKVFQSLGGFNNHILYSFDFDFFLRLNLKYSIYKTKNICAVYCMNDNASLRNDVIIEFYQYLTTTYIDFMKKNHIDDKFLTKYENEIRYSFYIQNKTIFDEEKVKDLKLLEVSKIRYLLFKLKSLLYYYMHNINTQIIR